MTLLFPTMPMIPTMAPTTPTTTRLWTASSPRRIASIPLRKRKKRRSPKPPDSKAPMSKLVGVVSHHEREVEELREDRNFAVEYLKAAMEALENPDERAGGLIMLRAVAEAHGGGGAVAAPAGISPGSLYRALSPKGNPTLKTLIAVLKTVGLRLTVTQEEQVSARKAKTNRSSVAA